MNTCQLPAAPPLRKLTALIAALCLPLAALQAAGPPGAGPRQGFHRPRGGGGGGGGDRDTGIDASARDRALAQTRLSDTQKENLEQLREDLLDIKRGSEVTEAQKTALAESLMALADGASKPSPESVKTLAEDLGEAISDGSLSIQEKTQLANDVAVVLGTANLPPSEVQAAIENIETILDASNVDKTDIAKVVADLEAIAKEVLAP